MKIEASNQTKILLRISSLPGIGKSTLWRIASSKDFSRTQESELHLIFPELEDFKIGSKKYLAASAKMDIQLERAEKLGCKIIGFWDDEYPNSFRRAINSPAIFWYRGNLSALKFPQVAVIGTREPTAMGEVTACRVTTALSKGGLCIVSGLALGIDSIAHKVALDVGGATIAVMPAGLDFVAPASNQELAAKILNGGGGLLSEFPIGLPPLPPNFVTRDATQAALSVAVVLIQSGVRGGSLHASRAIVKLRRMLVVAKPIGHDANNSEPKAAANMLFVTGNMDSIVKNLGFPADTGKFFRLLEHRDQYIDLVQELKGGWEQLSLSKRAVNTQAAPSAHG